MGLLFFNMSGKKKGKKEKKVLSLDTFLTEDDENWAAEPVEENFDAPVNDPDYDHGPSDNYERPGRNQYDSSRGRDRDYDRPRRNYAEAPPLPIPDHPPYTAHVGNLSFQATEQDLGELFASQVAVESVQIVTDQNTGKSRGFGFVTFKEREDLEIALDAHGKAELLDRIITVKVSSAPKGGRQQRAREPSRADTVDKWERGRGTPVNEEREQKYREQGPRRGAYERPGRRNYDAPKERTPITLVPRTSDAPIGAPAKTNKTNPFGEAKPRDEQEFQRKKEEERKQREEERRKRDEEKKQRDEERRSAASSKPSSFRNSGRGNKESTTGGRDFASARQNLGKNVKQPTTRQPVETQKKKPQESKKQGPKKFKGPTVNKEGGAAIATHNIYAKLSVDN